MSVQHGQADDGEVEPPVPPNLGKLSSVLSDFANFLHIDPDLMTAAAEASPIINQKPTRKELTAWVASLPEAEKDSILLGLMSEENPHARASLFARFNRDCKNANSKSMPTLRTAGELRSVVEERGKKRE